MHDSCTALPIFFLGSFMHGNVSSVSAALLDICKRRRPLCLAPHPSPGAWPSGGLTPSACRRPTIVHRVCLCGPARDGLNLQGSTGGRPLVCGRRRALLQQPRQRGFFVFFLSVFLPHRNSPFRSFPQVDLPEDPNLKDFTGSKPVFADKGKGGGTPKSGTPRTSRTSADSKVGVLMQRSACSVHSDKFHLSVQPKHFKRVVEAQLPQMQEAMRRVVPAACVLVTRKFCVVHMHEHDHTSHDHRHGTPSRLLLQAASKSAVFAALQLSAMLIPAEWPARHAPWT